MQGKIQFRVRYAETDAMAVVHHANYYVWFEMGRTELLREMGMEYKSLEAQGILSPVIETQCRYISSAKYDDLITLETELIIVERLKWAFGYRAFRGEELLAEGKTVHCFINREGRPISVKKAKPELYEIMLAKGLIK